MSRGLRLLLIVCRCLVVVGAALLWALPEIVRRVALDQIPKRTGRAVAIDDVDLNLFTGHLGIKKFRLTDRGSPEFFVELERLDVRLSLPALLRSHLQLSEIVLTGPSIRVVRTGPAEFNFSDLLGSDEATRAPEASPPGRWTITVERLRVAKGRVRAEDRAVSPPAEWLIEDLGVEIDRFTTRVDAPPGRLTIHAKINEAVLDVRADPLRHDPPHVRAQLSVAGFELRRLDPYVYTPLSTPYRPRGRQPDSPGAPWDIGGLRAPSRGAA